MGTRWLEIHTSTGEVKQVPVPDTRSADERLKEMRETGGFWQNNEFIPYHTIRKVLIVMVN